MSRLRFATSAIAALLLAAPALQAVDLPSIPGTDTKLKVYGFVESYATYFTQQQGSGSNGLNNSLFYGPATAGNSYPTNQFAITINTSRIGFATTTPSANLGDVTTKIEADFNGSPWHLRHAYINLAGFTFGQTWSNFADLDAEADTVDWAGPIGTPNFDTPRFPQIRYTASLDKQNTLAFSLEQNNGYNDGATQWTTPAMTQKSGKSGGDNGQPDGRYPTLVGAYTFADAWGHVGFRGLAQNVGAFVPATATTASYRYNKIAPAFELSGNVNIGKNNLVASVYSGQALGQYGTGFQAANLIDSTQTVNTYKSTGWLVGYTQTWTDAVRSNLVLSGVTFSSNSSIPTTGSGATTGTDIKTALSGNLNTIIKLTKSTELGFEYVFEQAKTFGSSAAVNSNGAASGSNSASKVEISLTANF